MGLMVLLIIDEKGEWKQITKEEKSKLSKEEQEKVLYLDKKLKEKLDFGIKQQKKKNDVVGLICGDEGSGKSTLAANIMRYVSKDKFDPKKDMVGADYDDGINKIDRAAIEGCLMFDEGNVFFLSTEVLKKEQRELHKIFSIFRQKRLFVLIVAPSFFRLGSYFTLDRSKFLCITYLKKGKRSFFKYFGDKKKEKLYMKGKKYHNDSAVKPQFRGRYDPCYLLENKEYDRFKLKTLTSSLKKAQDPLKKKHLTPKRLEVEFRKRVIANNIDKTEEELGKILGIKQQTVNTYKQKIKKHQILQN
jgi:ABC-type dipeptide/oligopeptide/nickel transport system ATPase component